VRIGEDKPAYWTAEHLSIAIGIHDTIVPVSMIPSSPNGRGCLCLVHASLITLVRLTTLPTIAVTSTFFISRNYNLTSIYFSDHQFHTTNKMYRSNENLCRRES